MGAEDRIQNLTRRQVLATAVAAAAGGWAVSRAGFAADQASGGAYGPFKMGLQSYSLRGLKKDGKVDLETALKATKELGVPYWESYPAHIPANTAEAETFKKKAAEYGVTVIGYGVNHFSKNHDANRKLFEFAKAMGLGYMSADPDLDSFDSLDKLVEEYGVAIGIHNHGPGHKFAKIDAIAAAIKDHSPKIGCCVDTGHFLRSREDPVRAVEVFGKRTFGVHLKDVKDATTFTELGKGDLRTLDLLKALAALKYDYCLALEYEEHESNPLPRLAECLATTRAAIAKLPGA